MNRAIHIKRLVLFTLGFFFFSLSGSGQNSYQEALEKGDAAFNQGAYSEALRMYEMARAFNQNANDEFIHNRIDSVLLTLNTVLQQVNQEIEKAEYQKEAQQKEVEKVKAKSDSLLLVLKIQEDTLEAIKQQAYAMEASLQQAKEEAETAKAEKELLDTLTNFNSLADRALKKEKFENARLYYDRILQAIDNFDGGGDLAKNRRTIYLQKKTTLTEFIQFYSRGDSLLKAGALSEAYHSFLEVNDNPIAKTRLKGKVRQAESLFPQYWKQLRKEGALPPLTRALYLSADARGLSGEMKKAKLRLARSIKYGFSDFSSLVTPELREFGQKYYRWYRHLSRFKISAGMKAMLGRQSSKPAITIYDGGKAVIFDIPLDPVWNIREFSLTYSPISSLEIGFSLGFSPENSTYYEATYFLGNNEISFYEPSPRDRPGGLGDGAYQSYFMLLKVYDSNKKWNVKRLNSFNVQLVYGLDLLYLRNSSLSLGKVTIINPQSNSQLMLSERESSFSYSPFAQLSAYHSLNGSSPRIEIDPVDQSVQNLVLGLQCNGYPFRAAPNISLQFSIRRRFASESVVQSGPGTLGRGDFSKLSSLYGYTPQQQQEIEDYIAANFDIPVEVVNFSVIHAWSISFSLAYEF